MVERNTNSADAKVQRDLAELDRGEGIDEEELTNVLERQKAKTLEAQSPPAAFFGVQGACPLRLDF